MQASIYLLVGSRAGWDTQHALRTYFESLFEATVVWVLDGDSPPLRVSFSFVFFSLAPATQYSPE